MDLPETPEINEAAGLEQEQSPEASHETIEIVLERETIYIVNLLCEPPFVDHLKYYASKAEDYAKRFQG